MATIKITLNELDYPFVSEINSKWKNGKLLSSSVQKHEGHEFFTLTGQGEEDGETVYFTQTVTHIGATKYVASVVGRGTDTRTDPDAKAFIGSFKALITVPDIPENSHENDRPQVGRDPDANSISQLMGSIAAFCVIAVVIGVVIKLAFGQKSKAERSSRRRRRQDEDDDDDEDRPRRRRHDDDDYDDEDRPRRRRHVDDYD